MGALTGKTAILTGASGGLGGYIARELALAGVNLFLTARSSEALEALARDLSDTGVQVLYATADINDETGRLNLIKRARTHFASLDILINNAGIEEIIPFGHQPARHIDNIIQTNLLSPILLTRAILPILEAQGHGHIINIASLAGRTGMPYGAAYAASKGGMAEWSLSLSGELRNSGINVSVVCPGFVRDAGMFARHRREAPGTLGSSAPIDVARAVVRVLLHPQPEVIVNPRPVRLLMVLRAISPVAAIAVAAKTGLLGFLRQIARDAEAADKH